MKKKLWQAGGFLLLLSAVGLAQCTVDEVAQTQRASGTPAFQVDPFWPKLDTLALGQVSGVAVDQQDHVWIIHRPWSVPDQERPSLINPDATCCTPAPPVVEFDAAGNYVQGWGGPGEGYEWPADEHTIHIDYKDNVWISSAGGPRTQEGTENQILKFTRSGQFLLQIGHRGQSKGSLDTENFNNAADIYVYPATNEVFVADGYNNRRVIVFDADSGEFKRMWGAYGNTPDDSAPRDPVTEGPGPQQFNLVHGLRVSDDGRVYVADRRNNRVQVFNIDGEFQKEIFIAREAAGGLGTACAIGFSPDSTQRYMYVPDPTHGHVRIFDRESLDELGLFGRWGRYAGQFLGVHSIAVDSQGNIYTAEVLEGRRVQKFALQSGS